MNGYSRTLWIIFTVGFALACLVSVQIYWAFHAYRLTEKEFASDVKEAMKKTVEDINRQLTCFETFSKVRINRHEGFYILKQKWANHRFADPLQSPPDTIPMYYDNPDVEVPFEWTNIMFSTPVNVSMILQFEYQLNDVDSANSSANSFEKVTLQNYRDAFSEGKSIEERYNPRDLDSLLKINLAAFSIDESYHFGYLDDNRGRAAFLYLNKDSVALQKSPFRIQLTQSNYFSRPYDLTVVFDNYSSHILSGIRALLIISASIIAILLVSFYLFVRIILRQRRLSELKNDFINNMTHEFKTPLTNITLAIENISESKSLNGPPREGMLKIIGQETERLRENIERILQIARFEKEKLQLNLDQVDIHNLVQKVVCSFDSIFPEDGIIFRCNFSASNYVLNVDETHLFNVIYNLVDNSIKYNTNKPEIEISTKDFKKGVMIKVKDNGIGISANDQKKIFEKFYRVPKGNLHDVKGYGLGLSYVRLVVDSHGGYILVNSQAGHGCEIEVYIPSQE